MKPGDLFSYGDDPDGARGRGWVLLVTDVAADDVHIMLFQIRPKFMLYGHDVVHAMTGRDLTRSGWKQVK